MTDRNNNFFKTLSKYRIYIYLMVFLFIGTAIFYGLTSSGDLMRDTAESYLEEFDVEDIKLVSSHGIGQEDLDLLEESLEASSINVGYQMDVGIEGGASLVSVESMPESWVKFDLKEGSFPQKPGEIAIDEDLEDFPYAIGDTIKLVPKGDNPMMRLKTKEYTIVGRISSPEYILKSEKGSSNFTGSSLDGYALIMPEDFDLDKPNFARIHLASTEDLSYFSEDYKTLVDNASFNLTQAFQDMPEKKLVIVKEEAKTRIDQATSEIKDLEQQRIERSQAQEEEGQAIEEQRKAYQQAKADFDEELATSQELMETGADKKEQLEAKVRVLDQNHEELQKKYDEQEALTNQAYAQYEPVKNEYEALEASIDERQASIEAEFTSINQRLADISQEISSLRSERAAGGIRSLLISSPEIRSLEDERDGLEARLDELATIQAEIDQDYSTLASLEADYSSLGAEYQSQQQILGNFEHSLNEVKDDLEATKEELDELSKDIDKADRFLKEEKDPQEKALAEDKKDLDEAERTHRDKTQAYETFMKDSEAEILSLGAIRDRSQEEMDGKVMPSYDIEASSDNTGMDLYSSITNRVDMMTSVFPAFLLLLSLFIVAAFCYQALSKNRAGQRLGLADYLRLNQTALVQVLLSMALAIILGLVVATLLSLAIFNLYGESFIFSRPIFKIFPGQLAFIVGGVLLALLLAFILAYLGLDFRLKLNIERPSLKNWLSRPLRILGSILSLAGSVALVLLGLTLFRSISNVSDIQYKEIVRHQAEIELPEGIEKESLDELDFYLTDVKNARDVRNVASYTASSIKDGYPSVDFRLLVPDRIQDFDQQMRLVDKDGQVVPIPDRGIILSEKICQINDIKAGDTIGFTIGESKRHEAEVTGIFENYVSDFAYISPGFYKEITGQEPGYSQKHVVLKDSGQFALDNFVRDTLEYDDVQNINTVADAKNDVDNIILPLQFISIIYIIVGLLFFLLILALQTGLITDKRVDEIGPGDEGLVRSIQAQHFIQALIGLALGLALGSRLFAIMTNETVRDNIRISSQIYWLDYAIIAIVLLVFLSFRYVQKAGDYNKMLAGEDLYE